MEESDDIIKHLITMSNAVTESMNDEQKVAFNTMLSGKNIFLTGQAGTGKSFMIHKFNKYITERGKKVAITSTTGISAMLINGRTIHSWAGIGLGNENKNILLTKVRRKSNAVKNWKYTDILVLDEISMLSPILFEKLEFIARNIRGNERPFGGLQVILTGDFCQLPPVETDLYCFQIPLWDILIDETIELKTIMRQTDTIFQGILTRCRMAELTDEDKAILLSRKDVDVGFIDHEHPEQSIRPTRIFPHRKTVDDINNQELEKLKSNNNTTQHSIMRFLTQDKVIHTGGKSINMEEAKTYIEHFNKISQARTVVDLCIGAQVMLIQNLDVEGGLCNGSRGVIVDFEQQRPIVKFMNGLKVLIQYHEWSYHISDEIKVIRKQVPLILAFAITCHKIQAATIDCAEIDISDVFCDGQAYVALSRVKSIENLKIIDIDFDKITVNSTVKEFYNS